MPSPRKPAPARAKKSAAQSEYVPSSSTRATSLPQLSRGRGLSLVLAGALGLQLVGGDHPVGGRVLAHHDDVDAGVERVRHLTGVGDLHRVRLAGEIFNGEVDAAGVAIDAAAEHPAADLDVLAVVLAGGQVGDLAVVRALSLHQEDDADHEDDDDDPGGDQQTSAGLLVHADTPGCMC